MQIVQHRGLGWRLSMGLLGALAGYITLALTSTLVQEVWLGGVSYRDSGRLVLILAGLFTPLCAFVGGIIGALVAGQSRWLAAATLCGLCALSVALAFLPLTATAAKDYGLQVYVVFQVCRPGHSISEDVTLGYSSVTDSSSDGAWIPARNYLASNEPVFYEYAAEPNRVRAIVVQFLDAKKVRFVFDVPPRKDLQFDAWSSWQKASGVTENERVETMIRKGKAYERTEPPESSPLIRYRMMQFNDFLKTVTKKGDPAALVEGGRCA